MFSLRPTGTPPPAERFTRGISLASHIAVNPRIATTRACDLVCFFFFCCKASDSRLLDHKHEPTPHTLLTDSTMKARVHNKARALLQAKPPPTNKKKTCSCPHTAMFEHEKKRSILVAYFALSFKIHLPPKMFRTPKCSAHSRSPNGRHIRHQKRHASSVASSDHDICGS